MKVTKTELEGVWIMEPQYFEDDRGYYVESYSKRTLAQHGITADFVQDGHSYSRLQGTIRGIHFQRAPHAQAKLVRCTRGRVMDVAVDLRKGSPTYKQWIAVELSCENRRQLFIPRGFGHGFETLTPDCELQYKVDAFYCPQEDRSVAWNDGEIGIHWHTADPILSAKDARAPKLCDSDVNFVME